MCRNTFATANFRRGYVSGTQYSQSENQHAKKDTQVDSSGRSEKEEKARSEHDDDTSQEKDHTTKLAVTAAGAAGGIYLIRHYTREVEGDRVITGEDVSPSRLSLAGEIYKSLPLRVISRAWGAMNSVTLPRWMRSPVYKGYSALFGCNLDEVEGELEDFANLGEFFTRRLKEGARPICMDPNALASPVDGRILCFGKLIEDDGDIIEQVKGVRYKLSALLGERNASYLADVAANAAAQSPRRDLYHCIIYLAPGDYHGYHSPVDMVIKERLHIPGYMMSVSTFIVPKIPGLFALNERIVLRGEWGHGFFAYCPVAATNVGNMTLDFDDAVVTNRSSQSHRSAVSHKSYQNQGGIRKKRGDMIGFFRLGSTVVMLFESPSFRFSVEPGQKVQLGEKLGSIVQ